MVLMSVCGVHPVPWPSGGTPGVCTDWHTPTLSDTYTSTSQRTPAGATSYPHNTYQHAAAHVPTPQRCKPCLVQLKS